MDPKTWGPGIWHFLHVIGLVYPNEPTDEDKKNNLNFLKSFSMIIPCPFCKLHFLNIINSYPPKLDSRLDFFKWTIDVHNLVNQITGKKEISYEEAVVEMSKNESFFKLISERDKIFELLK